jgi:hypothetical protein
MVGRGRKVGRLVNPDRAGRPTPAPDAISAALPRAGAVPGKGWSELATGARVYRLVHVALASLELSCLAYVWTCAFTRRRDRWLHTAIAILAIQGIGMVIGRGDCPLGPVQQRLGDPTPLFELVLPPKAAKVVFPILGAVTLGGLVALVVRQPL